MDSSSQSRPNAAFVCMCTIVCLRHSWQSDFLRILMYIVFCSSNIPLAVGSWSSNIPLAVGAWSSNFPLVVGAWGSNVPLSLLLLLLPTVF